VEISLSADVRPLEDILFRDVLEDVVHIFLCKYGYKKVLCGE
jgi:hypothetical protein